jgi:hypothetical protein
VGTPRAVGIARLPGRRATLPYELSYDGRNALRNQGRLADSWLAGRGLAGYWPICAAAYGRGAGAPHI